MLRFTARRKNRISNRLAIFAGLMLMISSLAGMNQANPVDQENAGAFADNQSVVPEVIEVDTAGPKPASKSKGFKVSLFLFRLD